MPEILRGWRALAAQADRSIPTCRDWVRNGCPHKKDGAVYLFDWGEVSEWLQARRSVPAGDDTADAALLSREHKLEQIEKTREEKIKLRYQNKDSAKSTVDREQAQLAVAKMLSKLKRVNRKWLRELFAQFPEMTAEEQERIEAELINLFNEMTAIKIE